MNSSRKQRTFIYNALQINKSVGQDCVHGAFEKKTRKIIVLRRHRYVLEIALVSVSVICTFLFAKSSRTTIFTNNETTKLVPKPRWKCPFEEREGVDNDDRNLSSRRDEVLVFSFVFFLFSPLVLFSYRSVDKCRLFGTPFQTISTEVMKVFTLERPWSLLHPASVDLRSIELWKRI